MSVNSPQNMDESGEIIFKHQNLASHHVDPMHQSPSKSQQEPESFPSHSENRKDESFDQFQRLIVNQLSNIDDRMEGQLACMNNKIAGQLNSMRDAINEVREESDKMWLTIQNKGNTSNPLPQNIRCSSHIRFYGELLWRGSHKLSFHQ